MYKSFSFHDPAFVAKTNGIGPGPPGPGTGLIEGTRSEAQAIPDPTACNINTNVQAFFELNQVQEPIRVYNTDNLQDTFDGAGQMFAIEVNSIKYSVDINTVGEISNRVLCV